MGEPPETTPTTRLRGHDPAPGRIVALALVAVVLAVLKPWAGDAPAAPAPRPTAATPVPRVTSPPPRTEERGDLHLHCHEPSGWRVYAHQSWKRGLIRTWRTVQPASLASGPLDDTLPEVRVPDTVTALGYCAPWQGDEQPPEDAQLTVWLVLESARNGEAVAALQLVHVAPEEDTSLGGLYEPAQLGLLFGDGDPTARPVGPAPWPVNRYVFALRERSWERWWVVRVGDPPGGSSGAEDAVSARPIP